MRDKTIPIELVIPYKNQSLILINTTELIGYDIYWYGGYENSVLWVLDFYLKQDDVVIDFGANIGVWSIVLAKKCNFVHSVEPHPIFRERLISNFELNQLNNFKIYSCAVSQTEGSTTLFAPPDEMRNKSASIVNLNSELTQHISVEVKSMDAIFSNLSRLNFMKIDCDGSDGDIILSGKTVISKHRPIILFEDLGFHKKSIGNSSIIQKVDEQYNEAFALLKNLQYRFFEIKDQHMIETERVIGRYTNILAIPSLKDQLIN